MSDETTYTIDVGVKGGSAAEAAAAQVEHLGVALDAASKAASDAGAAVKAGDKAYSQAEQSADRAAKSLEKIGVAVAAQKSKLKAAANSGDDKSAQAAAAKLQQLGIRQAEAVAKANQAKAALVAEAAALDKLKASASAAEAAESKLTKEHDEAKKKEAELAKETEKVSEGFEFASVGRGLGKLGGPLADVGRSVVDVGEGFKKLSKQFGATGAAAIGSTVLIAALAAGIIALGVAIADGIVKIIEWTVKLADANRNALLLAQGIAKTVAGGTLLNDKINALTKTLPTTQEELQETAKKLAESGLRGQALANALEKSAIAAAKLKFGPDFAREMLSLDEQTKVFKANLSETFGGLKTDGLMKGLQILIKLFDANTASGRAMKVVFESIFQPMIDWLAKNSSKIERFFLQLEILALKALIAIKPFGSVIVSVLVTPLKLAGEAVLFMFTGFLKLVAVVGKAVTALRGMSLADVGHAMMQGLVQGIEAGGAAILAALKGAVMGAVNGVKSLLGIHSPSKVFAEIGMNTGAGMSEGVERSAPGVQRSLESMVAPPAPGGRPAPPGAPGSGGKSISLSNVKFEFYGVEGAEQGKGQFVEAFTRLLEGDVAQLGAAVPIGAT
jgi:hypothetical protein